MGTLIERVKLLELPLDQLVVMGSGLLDAWGLRDSNDIDIAVSAELFQTLHQSGKYKIEQRYGEDMLTLDDLEIWQSWGQDSPFSKMQSDAVVVDDVAFVSPKLLIEKKKARGSEKDRRDIELLEEFLHEK